MSIDEALEVIERQLLFRQLNPIERFVFQQSWLGRNYHDMAQDCSYGTTYIKEVGSQLWQDLSRAMGERVTKKNLPLVLGQYQRHLAAGIADRGMNAGRWILGCDGSEQLRFDASQTHLEFPSGPIPLDSPLYIDRPPLEAIAFAEITQPGCALRIRAPRKLGKSSLLIRLLAKANWLGYRTVYIDFQEADRTIFESLDQLLRWFCTNVSRQLDLNPLLPAYWNEDIGSKVSCKVYFEAYLLEQIQTPIVLALNEVNRLLEYPTIAQDFLSMLRLWHEQAKQHSLWRKLRFVIAQNTDVSLSTSFEQSPFDVGLSLTLPPFTLEQVQDLAIQYGLEWARDEIGKQQLLPLYTLLGGYPYLVNLAFYHLYRSTLSLEKLLETATDHSGIYGQYLREHLAIIQTEPALLFAIQQLINSHGEIRLEGVAIYQLESMGLIQLDGTLAKFSCELYRNYFQKHLSEPTIPRFELSIAEEKVISGVGR